MLRMVAQVTVGIEMVRIFVTSKTNLKRKEVDFTIL